MDTRTFQIKDELGFCTRQNDGISGMTVTALANFCGVDQPVITNLLNRLRDSDSILNELPPSLKSFAGKDWRLILKDGDNSLFILDEVCHAILEYYAVDARKYKGKAIALENYRMVARAGLRVFIWSQTGYSPQTKSAEQLALYQDIPAMQQAIAQLQAQIQNLLPLSADFIPPGWNEEVWRKLPPQDKRHFRFLYRRRGFRPSGQGTNEQLALPPVTTEQLKQKNPGNGQDKTWQYKLHLDVLNKLLKHRKCKTEPSKFNGEQHHRSDPETSKPQQNTAVEEVKGEGVKQSEYEPVRQAKEPEPPQTTHFVDESEQDDSTSEIDPHENECSEPEVEVSSSTYKPSKQEIAEVCTELRRLRINPEPCLGVVKKYWSNVAGALAYLKEALQTWQSVNSPTGVFITACKEGKKSQNTATADVIAWYEWAKRQRIVAAMSGNVVYTPSGEPMDLQQMMRQYPCECS